MTFRRHLPEVLACAGSNNEQAARRQRHWQSVTVSRSLVGRGKEQRVKGGFRFQCLFKMGPAEGNVKKGQKAQLIRQGPWGGGVVSALCGLPWQAASKCPGISRALTLNIWNWVPAQESLKLGDWVWEALIVKNFQDRSVQVWQGDSPQVVK